jgi:hypothetical protein
MSTWEDYCKRELNGLLPSLLKKFSEEFKCMEEVEVRRDYYDFESGYHKKAVWNPRIEVTGGNKYGGTYAVEFNLVLSDGAKTQAIRFGLDVYPNCCAMNQLNNFYHSHDISQELLNEFVEQCISVYNTNVSQSVRLMMNCVEYNSRPGLEYTTTDVVPSIDDPRINYPKFYAWAKRYQFQEQCFVNHNTGSIIHNVVINYARGVL